MHDVSRELDEIFDRVDSQTAAMLERTVRNAVALAVQRTGNFTAKDSMRYPLGYFQATEGCFADEHLKSPMSD